jgi:hypothetical protein
MAAKVKAKRSKPTVGQGDRAEDHAKRLDVLEVARINTVLETLRAVRAEDDGDFWNELRNGSGLRRLAKRLEVPLLLLKFVDEERMGGNHNESIGVLPGEVSEWNEWNGRLLPAVAKFVVGVDEKAGV